MTWHAQAGKLVLTGDEATLFRDAIAAMCDVIIEAEDDDASFFDGATVFDRMSRSQQLASLEAVACHLFRKTDECLPLTAWSEATLASVLHEVRGVVEREVDEGDTSERRRTILDALDAHEEVDGFDDRGERSVLLDAYEERFLWDLDYEDEEATDLPPGRSEQNRLIMGIGEDYYSSIPPDLGARDSLQRGAERVMRAIAGGALVTSPNRSGRSS